MDIRVSGCGVATDHAIDYCHKQADCGDNWLLMCFQTPFFFQDAVGRTYGETGDCILQPPHALTWHGPLAGQRFQNDWIYIGGGDVDQAIATYVLPVNRLFSLGNRNCLTPFINTIINEQTLRRRGYPAKIQLAVLEMLLALYREMDNPYPASSTYRLFFDLRQEMLQNNSQPYTLEQLAQRTGYSVSRFSELYGLYFKVSPIEDLLASRIARAKNLLIGGGISIEEISRQCGFASAAYFSRIFRKRCGCSPSQFAR